MKSVEIFFLPPDCDAVTRSDCNSLLDRWNSCYTVAAVNEHRLPCPGSMWVVCGHDMCHLDPWREIWKKAYFILLYIFFSRNVEKLRDVNKELITII